VSQGDRIRPVSVHLYHQGGSAGALRPAAAKSAAGGGVSLIAGFAVVLFQVLSVAAIATVVVLFLQSKSVCYIA